MCGIIGCVGHGDDTLDVILDGLSTLEYRGYDSAGVAIGGETVRATKKEGRLEVLCDSLSEHADELTGSLGIGHTR